MTTLVIIESPNKKAKLEELLGPGYVVRASYGHVRDLPRNALGVDAPEYTPHYAPTDERAERTLASLRQAARGAQHVLLATDPDREGEAIAWHLAEALQLRERQRITYNEITATALQTALAHPRPLNMALVRAQEARRVLDRLVGYRVSPALSQKASLALSAGRVQSPATRLVVDRERAIRGFTATAHFGATLSFEGGWSAEWLPPVTDESPYITDRSLAERAASARGLHVVDFADTERRVPPPPPFITSTLQQRAQAALGFKPAKTMELAQALFGAGDITYMRTDAPTLSDQAYQELANYIRDQNWPLATTRRTWKAKASAQEAHEAIRPSHIEVVDAGSTEEQRALYRLIWQRTVACQLADARFAVRTANLESSEDILFGNDRARYRARGRTLVDPGWKALYDEPDEPKEGKDKDNDEAGEGSNPVPALLPGQATTAANGTVVAKTTKPPTRYTQATLVRELETHGIGRPATYASILENITRRGYLIEDKQGRLFASPLGETLIDALVGTFGFLELDYTRALEEALDEVADGTATYLDTVSAADNRLRGELGRLAAPGLTFTCPTCSKPLRRVRCAPERDPKGKGYDFWGCTGYPECKCTFPTGADQTPDFSPPKEKTDGRSKKAVRKPARRSPGGFGRVY